MEGHREAPGPPHVLISELCLALPAGPDAGDTRCDRPLGWAEVCADSCFCALWLDQLARRLQQEWLAGCRCALSAKDLDINLRGKWLS